MTLRSRPPRTAASRLARLALGIVLLHGGAALAQDARIVIGQSIALSADAGEHGQGAAGGEALPGPGSTRPAGSQGAASPC